MYVCKQTDIHTRVLQCSPASQASQALPNKEMSYGIFITLHSKTKCVIQSFNFILFSTTVFEWCTDLVGTH